ncbi:MAG: serine/threonine-protein kinase [Planctomycetota bacterium]
MAKGKRLGSYTLISELGSGGMGTVHLAEVAEAAAGLEPSQQVAVKIVHPHLLSSPGFFKRFMREAELGRKVIHENVVRTFDVDATEMEGKVVHYMAMEYVRGKSLRSLLIDLGAIPETLLREIALQAAAGLAAIHEAGIVHRDLKPENILITDDNQIRIMDLGVAKLQEASIAITKEGQFAGSVLYAAPEQFGREEIGSSVDLYSLGVMLYELATGDNPFRRDDAAAVIEAHLKLNPPRITDLNTDVTDFFSECTATLLAKQPTKRFASAEALHSVLTQAEQSQWWTELAPKLRKRVAHLPRIRVRRETELHGREDDLGALNAAWAKARGGEGNSVFIEGEAGIGKTRLIDAFLRGLEEEVHVLYGSYPPSGGLGGISDAIIGKFGSAQLAESLTPYLTETPSLVPAFAALLKHESPPTGAADSLQGDALSAVCVHLMRALAEEKPVVWITDDLHFAPRESRDLVLALARAVEGQRVLLLSTARPGVPDDELAHFSRLENYRRVALDRLGAREVVQLLADAFRSDALAEKLAGKIAVKSDGVPFFVFEMIRGLKEGQFIRQEADGTYVQTQLITEIEVPSAVKDLIEGRLRGLTESQRAILDAGAVQGMEFDPALVADVVEEKKVRVLRELAEIERRHGLVHGEAGKTRFDQNQIQEVIYQDLTPDLRSEYHTLLAESYSSRLEGEPSGEQAIFLASHHLRGSRPKESAPHLLSALDCLGESYRNEALIQLATRALEVPGFLEGSERVEVLLRKAWRDGLRGERVAQRAALDEALSLADQGEDQTMRVRTRNSLGYHLKDLSSHGDAQRRFEEARELATELGDRKLEGEAINGLGLVAWAQSRFEQAHDHFQEWLSIAREIGDRRGEGYGTGNLGLIVWNWGRTQEARQRFEEWLGIAREVGDRKHEATATGNLGLIHMREGRFKEASEQFARHLALARENGDRTSEARAVGNLANTLSMRGRYEDAKEGYERHIALAREVEHRRSEAVGLDNLGFLLSRLGQPDRAKEVLDECLRVTREIGSRRTESYAWAALGITAERQGDLDESRRHHEGALALRREISYRSGVAASLVSLGRVEAAQGEREAAASHLSEALSLARDLDIPEEILAATVELARLPGGDVGAARAALQEYEESVSHEAKTEYRFRLWELTKESTHLAEAKRLLDFAVDHSPTECRESMIENVPLHRDIMRAWTKDGAKADS